MNIKSLKGMVDLFSPEIELWQQLEKAVNQTAALYGYREVRTPIMERTELFLRGVGDSTDIVNKEMYTFTDKGGRSITLRPENTAAVVRAMIEKGLVQPGHLSRLYYIGPMFRYERPQKGRQRQFHQFGMEAVGSDSAMVDVEVIALAMEIFRDFGIRNMGLKLNTVGCPACVPDYVEKLRKYFTGREDLCGDCVKRLEKNPMRILDCKIATCASFNEDVPRREDHVCTVCSEHFGVVTEQLTNLGVEYTIDERLVRGLDYYTRTAFEVTCPSLGAQDAIGGGGRYDGLFAQLGGKEMPAVGFASGMERVLLARLAEGEMPAPAGPDVYCCPQTTAEAPMAMQVAENLRKKGISCEINLTFRKFKQQMKEASVSGASYAMVIGEDERQNNQVTIKNMKTREQNTVKSDQVTEYIKK